MQYSIVSYSIMQYSIVQYSIVWYSLVCRKRHGCARPEEDQGEQGDKACSGSDGGPALIFLYLYYKLIIINHIIISNMRVLYIYIYIHTHSIILCILYPLVCCCICQLVTADFHPEKFHAKIFLRNYGIPIALYISTPIDTPGFHNFNLRIFNLRVSNPNKFIVDAFLTRCRISMCQSLGPKKHDEISEIDCKTSLESNAPDPGSYNNSYYYSYYQY